MNHTTHSFCIWLLSPRVISLEFTLAGAHIGRSFLNVFLSIFNGSFLYATKAFAHSSTGAL